MLRDKAILLGQGLIKKGPWFLAPFSFIYASVVFVRNFLYDSQFLSITKVPPVVVSIGNIVAGGTGKTPFVLALAEKFKEKKVAILSREYGNEPDEPLLLAKRLPFASVFIGKNRAEIAKLLDHFDLIILDDGFQHRKLHRDFDIVLDKGKKEHYLPWGFLRDSPRRLSKCDAVFTLGKDVELRVKRIVDAKGNAIDSIRNWKVGIFSGIANPENFRETVKALGAEIVEEKIFADHGSIKLENLPKTQILVCTEKDFVKLPRTDLPIIYLEMEMVPKSPLWEMVIEKISRKIDNKRTYE